MALNPEVAKQIKEIRQGRVHGASWLSRQAIGIMNLAVEKSAAKDVADLLEELRMVGRDLVRFPLPNNENSNRKGNDETK